MVPCTLRKVKVDVKNHLNSSGLVWKTCLHVLVDVPLARAIALLDSGLTLSSIYLIQIM